MCLVVISAGINCFVEKYGARRLILHLFLTNHPLSQANFTLLEKPWIKIMCNQAQGFPEKHSGKGISRNQAENTQSQPSWRISQKLSEPTSPREEVITDDLHCPSYGIFFFFKWRIKLCILFFQLKNFGPFLCHNICMSSC